MGVGITPFLRVIIAQSLVPISCFLYPEHGWGDALMPAFGAAAGRGETAAVCKNKFTAVTDRRLDDEPFREADAFDDMR